MSKTILVYDDAATPGRHVVPLEGDIVQGARNLISVDNGNILKVGSDGGMFAERSSGGITPTNFDFIFNSGNAETRSLGKISIPQTGLYTYKKPLSVAVPEGVTQLQFIVAVPNALAERGGFRVNTQRGSSSLDGASFAEPPFDQLSMSPQIFFSGYSVSSEFFNNFDKVSITGTYILDCTVTTRSGTAAAKEYQCKVYMSGLGMVNGMPRQVVREAFLTIEVSP